MTMLHPINPRDALPAPIQTHGYRLPGALHGLASIIDDSRTLLDWRTDRRELLVSIPAELSTEARFYGDDGAAGRRFKGWLDLSEPNRWLVAWLAE